MLHELFFWIMELHFPTFGHCLPRLVSLIMLTRVNAMPILERVYLFKHRTIVCLTLVTGLCTPGTRTGPTTICFAWTALKRSPMQLDSSPASSLLTAGLQRCLKQLLTC